MTRELIGFLAIALVAIVALLIWASVARKTRQQELVTAKPQPAKTMAGIPALYVSTVFKDRPLDRLWAHGLGMRGRAELSVNDSGLNISRRGEAGIYIPAEDLKGIGSANATIDKGVERDGLSVIEWRLGQQLVLTHFRFSNPAAREEFEARTNQLLGARLG